MKFPLRVTLALAGTMLLTLLAASSAMGADKPYSLVISNRRRLHAGGDLGRRHRARDLPEPDGPAAAGFVKPRRPQRPADRQRERVDRHRLRLGQHDPPPGPRSPARRLGRGDHASNRLRLLQRPDAHLGRSRSRSRRTTSTARPATTSTSTSRRATCGRSSPAAARCASSRASRRMRASNQTITGAAIYARPVHRWRSRWSTRSGSASPTSGLSVTVAIGANSKRRDARGYDQRYDARMASPHSRRSASTGRAGTTRLSPPTGGSARSTSGTFNIDDFGVALPRGRRLQRHAGSDGDQSTPLAATRA